MEKEPLFRGWDIERRLRKGREEIALGQRLVGLGIVEFKRPVGGQHQQRRTSERRFNHGRQIVRRRRSRGAHETRQSPSLRRALSPEGGTAFVIE